MKQLKSIILGTKKSLSIDDYIQEKLKINSKSKVYTKNPDDWTIEDAEDGDIILTRDTQFIYKCLDKNKEYSTRTSSIIYHACYSLSSFHRLKRLHIGPDIGVGTIDDNEYKYKLSSKEECKELFDALDKAGYKWDETKLEVIKK